MKKLTIHTETVSWRTRTRLAITLLCMALGPDLAAQVNPTNFPPSSYLISPEVVGASYSDGIISFTLYVQPATPVSITVRATAVNNEGQALVSRDCFLPQPGYYPLYTFGLQHPDLVNGGRLILSNVATNLVKVSFPRDGSFTIPAKAKLYFESETATVDELLTAKIPVAVSTYLPVQSAFYLEERAADSPDAVLRSQSYYMHAGQTRIVVDWPDARSGTMLTLRGVEAGVAAERNSIRMEYPPTTVGFTAAAIDAVVGQPVVATVTRVGPLVGGMTVEYEAVSESATEAHFVPTNGVIRFAEKQRYAEIQVGTIYSTEAPYKTFSIRLRNPVGGSVAADQRNLRVSFLNSVRLDKTEYMTTGEDRLQGKVVTLAPVHEDHSVSILLPGDPIFVSIPSGKSEASFDLWFPIMKAAFIRLQNADGMHSEEQASRVIPQGYNAFYAHLSFGGATVKEGETATLTLFAGIPVLKDYEFRARWNGSAVAGIDYEPLISTARLSPTNETASVSFRALARGGVQPQRDVKIELTPLDEPDRVVASALVSIVEPSVFVIESAAGIEGERPGMVTVRFTGAPQRFRYFTRDLEAKAGVDFIAQSGEVLNRIDAVKIEVPLLDDGVLEPDKRLELVVESLDNPDLVAVQRITISDNEIPLPVEFTPLNVDLYDALGIPQPDGTLLLVGYDGSCYSVDQQRRASKVRDVQLRLTALALDTTARLSTGDWLVVESSGSGASLRHLKPDGLIDPASYIPLPNGAPSGLVVDGQDRIYLSTLTPSGRAAVLRLLPDGTVDPTFTPFMEDGLFPGRLWLAGNFLEAEFQRDWMFWLGNPTYRRLNLDNGAFVSSSDASEHASRRFTFPDGSALVFSGSRMHHVDADGSIRTNFVSDLLYSRIYGVIDGKIIGFQDGAFCEIPFTTDLEATTYEIAAMYLSENSTNTTFVTRRGNVSSEARLRISTSDETALRGRDYLVADTLIIPPLKHSALLAARAIDNFHIDEIRRFKILLNDEATGAVKAVSEIDIFDNDPAVKFKIFPTSPGRYQVLFGNPSSSVPTLQSAPGLRGPWTTIDTIPPFTTLSLEIEVDAPRKFWRALVPIP